MTLDFEAVFYKSPAPKMILNRKLEFVAANPAYLAMVDKSGDELLGRYVFDVFPETEDRVRQMTTVFEETFDGKDVSVTEIPFRITIDGTVREQWWTARHALLPDPAGGAPHLIQFSENVTEQVKMREMRNALMGELQHRVGNLFAIVGAIARQTARVAGDVPGFLSEFESRLRSLVRVNRQLRGDGEGGDTMASVIDHQLAVHTAEARDRIKVEGPDYPLSMLQAQAVSMAVHELATNSMKYGAIGCADGAISITWDRLPGDGCFLRWHETGIGTQTQPEKAGYGTMLLTTIIPSQLDGSAAREFGAESFTYSLEIGAAV